MDYIPDKVRTYVSHIILINGLDPEHVLARYVGGLL